MRSNKRITYYIAIRPKGQAVPPITEALTHHKSLERANAIARRINRTGSDVQVYTVIA